MTAKLKSVITSNGRLYRTINRIRRIRLHEPTIPVKGLAELGSGYGKWALDTSILDKNSICYSVGVGEDITFDLALIERVGCKIFALDPTPIAGKWISAQKLPWEFNFHPIGLAASDAEMEFQVPAYEGWHSFSVTAEPDAEERGSIFCPVRRLSTLMNVLGHESIDVLKMDIEGFEYSVVPDIVKTGNLPKQWLVEFHHGIYQHSVRETKEAVKRILQVGYQIAWISDLGREYAFIRG
jgi:FkbM family methyltransferase